MENIANMRVDDIVVEAEKVAKKLIEDKLKTGQIRNFYSAITRMRTDFLVEGKGETVSPRLQTDISMLKPKLAYAAGRQMAVRTTFYPEMKKLIDDIVNSNYNPVALNNFFLFIESVVAYHKFHGGE